MGSFSERLVEHDAVACASAPYDIPRPARLYGSFAAEARYLNLCAVLDLRSEHEEFLHAVREAQRQRLRDVEANRRVDQLSQLPIDARQFVDRHLELARASGEQEWSDARLAALDEIFASKARLWSDVVKRHQSGWYVLLSVCDGPIAIERANLRPRPGARARSIFEARLRRRDQPSKLGSQASRGGALDG